MNLLPKMNFFSFPVEIYIDIISNFLIKITLFWFKGGGECSGLNSTALRSQHRS